jgi:hypothetical protein
MELTKEDMMLHMPIESISWVASMAFPSAMTERTRYCLFTGALFQMYRICRMMISIETLRDMAGVENKVLM